MPTLVRLASKPGLTNTNQVNRVGGEPVGLTKDMWPLYQGRPMHHVVTVERDAVVAPLPEHVAAVAVFVNDVGDNEAFTPDTPRTKVLFLTAQDLARGETPASALFASLEGYSPAEPGSVLFEKKTYSFDEVRNPESLEDGPEDALDDDQVSYAISTYLQSERSGGLDGAVVHGHSALHVYWCQGAEAPEGQRVLFWFYEALVPGLNCGDGFFYVSASPDAKASAAWWQC
ncbi:MAG TPA: hypothetical protein PK141_26800 [Polyangiaceae bacterium]|nr:hypothetical protein [Polyangiaceae bacterium]